MKRVIIILAIIITSYVVKAEYIPNSLIHFQENINEEDSLYQERKRQLFKDLENESRLINYLNRDSSLLLKLKHQLIFNRDSTKFIGFYNELVDGFTHVDVHTFILNGIKYKDKWYHASGERPISIIPRPQEYSIPKLIYQHLISNSFYESSSTIINEKFWETYPSFGPFSMAEYENEKPYIDSLRLIIKQPLTSTEQHLKEDRLNQIRIINYHDAGIANNEKYLGLPDIVAWGIKEERKQQKINEIATLKKGLKEAEKEHGAYHYIDALIYPSKRDFLILPFNSLHSSGIDFILFEKTGGETYKKYKITLNEFEEVLLNYKWSQRYETFEAPVFWLYVLTKENGIYKYLQPID